MSNSKSVAIKINQDKLLANLQFSFSNNTTLLGELMQNSRRAGATKVSLESVDDTTLRISDDGKGIDDFQNLFSVAESGWDAETVRNERPFGMGFLSCLYQAEKIHIESNGHVVEGKTSDLLAGGALKVHELASKLETTYTTVTLYNFKLTKEQVEKALEKLAEGFAIPVFYNGVQLANNHALNVGKSDFNEVPGIGHIKVRYLEGKTKNIVNYMVVYLQGLPVFDDRRWSTSDYDVVHLDPTLYFARMPDRDKLVDESSAIDKINAAINQIHYDRLLKHKAELSPEKFAVRDLVTYALAIKGGADVINQKDVRFSNYFFGPVSSDQPSCYGEHDQVSHSYADESYSYEQVAAGEVKFCTIEHLCSYDEEDNCAAAWIFARKMGWPVIDGFGHTAREELLTKHWVAPFLHYLDNEHIQVVANGVGKSGSIGLNWWSTAVELCESYTITYTAKDGTVHTCTVDDEPVLNKDGVLLIPANAHNFGEGAVFQGASYEENDQFDNDAFEKDAQALNLYVNMLRTGDEVSSLQSLLNSVFLGEYKEFVGQKYELTLDENCKVVLTKLAA